MAAPPLDFMVISPHLDDAVLSLGAFIANAARSARRITVLTVFAGDVDSRAPASGWDRRGSFATEGEAARARRLEDAEACRRLGAEPSWLSFSEADYRDSLDEDGIWSAVTRTVSGANAKAVLVPGFPLTNPDHAWLSELLTGRGVPCRRVGLYAEQPYRYTVRSERPRPEAPRSLPFPIGERPVWVRGGGGLRDVWAKRHAIVAYRSQMALLGFSRGHYRKLNRMLVHETMRGGEAIMWLPSS